MSEMFNTIHRSSVPAFIFRCTERMLSTPHPVLTADSSRGSLCVMTITTGAHWRETCSTYCCTSCPIRSIHFLLHGEQVRVSFGKHCVLSTARVRLIPRPPQLKLYTNHNKYNVDLFFIFLSSIKRSTFQLSTRERCYHQRLSRQHNRSQACSILPPIRAFIFIARRVQHSQCCRLGSKLANSRSPAVC